jgi:hypothetical protein
MTTHHILSLVIEHYLNVEHHVAVNYSIARQWFTILQELKGTFYHFHFLLYGFLFQCLGQFALLP